MTMPDPYNRHGDRQDRISSLRPGWAPEGDAWRGMRHDDALWLADEWERAGGSAPDVDTSWVTTTVDRGAGWQLIAFMCLIAVCLCMVALIVIEVFR